ncbi:hypothetical protein QO034_19745 [Sedimentitalea sp. JM2-8]|uniref:Oxygen tolerance n=1 Tax=Sedimentitalea xiamensis TaxID=3050037 RepID=A0ABT7FJK4_9RHOB|nr:hypothetical protein [Sedimentitalea xiamensis]MDK3075317.1 hypothetical protein [Sedimentitalea xiamensis]
MVKGLILFLVLLMPLVAEAQTRTVDPGDLMLNVTLEPMDYVPFQGEMVLLTIHGIYRRHITLEKLEQPDMAGLNWMQLGQDHWFESMLDGRPVKNMRRRVAVFPDRSGQIVIGPFLHHLTLLDENNRWFEHTIQSEPVSFRVEPAPATDGWWFPVRGLRVSDNWSNAPDQLAPGEGVLRIVRVSALGASPDMLPPMPELTSPSALIFAHPEKRLVDLTPQGPEAVAFWRWTIKPRNDTSAIVEPISFSFFDTRRRVMQEVVISPQRVAYGSVVPVADTKPPVPEPFALRRDLILVSALAAFAVAAFGLIGSGRRLSLNALKQRWSRLRLVRALRLAGRRGDLAGLRRAGHALDRLYPADADRTALLMQLDTRIYGPAPSSLDGPAFARALNRTLRYPTANPDPRKTAGAAAERRANS